MLFCPLVFILIYINTRSNTDTTSVQDPPFVHDTAGLSFVIDLQFIEVSGSVALQELTNDMRSC